jgi:hypothetical protein
MWAQQVQGEGVGGESKEEAPNGPRNNPYAAIGVRAFTDNQVKGLSISAQIEDGEKRAAHEGHTVPEASLLTDTEISGMPMDCPALGKLRGVVKGAARRATRAAHRLGPARRYRSVPACPGGSRPNCHYRVY